MEKAVADDEGIEWREERDARAVVVWSPNHGLQGSTPTQRLEEWGRLRPERWLRRIPGRETFLARTPTGEALVVKRYAGDLWRDAWHERLRGRSPRTPARREFENLLALGTAGIPVPRAVGLCEASGPRGRRQSTVLMSHVEHEETLVERWTHGLAGRGAERVALVELVARLHDAGWYHRDLYLQHVLWSAGRAVLIDVGRARRDRRPRTRWFVKDLAALWHSSPAAITNEEADAFLGDYLAARGLDLAERAHWARRVARKAARIGRHAPRFVDSKGAR